MKRLIPAAAAVLGLCAAAGCAPHIWVNDHGHFVDAPVFDAALAADPAEPAFCIQGFHETWGDGPAPLGRYGGAEGAVGVISEATNFRSLRSIVADPRATADCDLLVDVGIDNPDAAGTSCGELLVSRPNTGVPLWRSRGCARGPLPYLARLMQSTFRPGNPYYQRYAAEKAAAPAPAAPAAVASAPAAPRSDLDELPAARARDPRAYAVVVGVERYREKLPKAEFAAADAVLAAKYFERVLGVPEDNVALLTDDRATKSDFEKYFESWLPNHVESGDTVYVYYSGHGAPNPAKGDAYLVPYDADPTYIDRTGYAVARLMDDLAKLPAKQVYVAMDSCFSGAGGRSVIAKGARPLVSVRSAEVPANITLISAAAADQISNGDEAQGHGLFTYYFLKGLKEKGPDLRAAFDFAEPAVARAARRDDNADQVPQWRSGR